MSAATVIDLSTRRIKIYASAYDAQARADLDAHLADVANPHGVTKGQVGLGAADNTSDANKPVSTAQADALALKAPLASPALTGTPTAPTAVLGTATPQLATTAFVQAAVTVVAGEIGEAGADLDNHLADTSNPHGVTKSQVGLGNVDNTSDTAKPVSSATQAALNAAAASTAAVAADLSTHAGNTGNPHAVTAAQLGLDQVDNTADADKPVSAPQQAAINVATAAAADAQLDIDDHLADVANPHGVTKAQVGLGNVDNTSDLAKPVSPAQQAAINVAAAAAATAQADIDAHQANTSNPHAVDAADVGLGNVANLAPADLPVSSATQTALNLKAPLASPALTGTPTAPTAAPGTATPQLATTAFTAAAVAVVAGSAATASAAAAAAQADADAAQAAAAAAQADATQALADAAAAQADATQALADAAAAAAADDALPVQVATPASGATVVLTDLHPIYVHTAALAALTIRLPPGAPGLVEICFENPVTALAVQNAAGAAVAGAPTSAYGPGSAQYYRYVDTLGFWAYWK